MRECFILHKQVNNKNQKGCYVDENTSRLRVKLEVLDSEVKACCISCRSPSGNGKEARRRMWRVVGIRVVLLRNDGDDKSVVVKDDAVLELCAPLPLSTSFSALFCCCNCAFRELENSHVSRAAPNITPWY